MKIKIYNNNGKVTISKVMNRKELVMFSDLPDGEVAEIEIDARQCTSGKRKKLNK